MQKTTKDVVKSQQKKSFSEVDQPTTEWKLPLDMANNGSDSEEDEYVYPLSVVHDQKKVKWKLIIKFTFLALLLLFFVLFLIFSASPFRRLPFRVGYFADQITEETISMDEVTEIEVQTKDCVVYLLENTDSTNEIDLYISAPRSTEIDTSREDSKQRIGVLSNKKSVKCSIEIRIPGGVTIQKLSFNFEGDKIPDLILYDYKGGSTWTSPMKIGLLDIKVSDSYPNILFRNAHEITELSISGSYCVANFDKLKISRMNFAVTLGSLSIVQNNAIPVNKMTVNTPHGTHCVAGGEVKSVDSNCPDQATRDAGISGTFINTATYCTSEMYVCSDSADS